MTAAEIAFGLVGALVLGAGALAVTTTRVVHAALWLAVTLAAAAGCFLVLAAELVAWIHVLVSVGAVVVLLLFALLLTRPPPEPAFRAVKGRLAVAGTVAVATAAVLLVAQLGTFGRERIDVDGTEAATAEVLGGALFGGWGLPFEALSVLLLAALVGAVALSRGHSNSGDLSGRTTPRPGKSRTVSLPAEEGPPGGGG